MTIQELIKAIRHWDMVKGMIYPCLAPRRWEKVRSLQAVSRRFLDLAVYYIIRTDDGDDMMDTWVNGREMRIWGIDMDTLDAQARENARKDGYTVQAAEETGADALPGMYMVTNRYCFYGAAGILDKAMLAQFADEKGTDIYILPPSVHEAMLLPATGKEDERDLNEMVKDMSGWAVRPEERLADHAYRYKRSGDIRIL